MATARLAPAAATSPCATQPGSSNLVPVAEPQGPQTHTKKKEEEKLCEDSNPRAASTPSEESLLDCDTSRARYLALITRDLFFWAML